MNRPASLRLLSLGVAIGLAWTTACRDVVSESRHAGDSGPGDPPIFRRDHEVPPAEDPDAVRRAPSGPTLEGPVAGLGSPWLSGTSFDLDEVDYVAAEYFFGGVANGYAPVGELTEDGRWQVEPADTAEYRTRFVLYRPRDAAAFNGSVIVEWLNVSAGFDSAPDWIMMHTELVRDGWVWVGVSAQEVGVEGHLKRLDAERYGSLKHPGDTFSYDIFSQVAQVLRGHQAEVDPLEGLIPERILATGESQSAFRLVTYVNAIDPVAELYDGFLIHSRGGGAAPLSQDPLPAVEPPGVVLIREETRVPVLVLQTETDLIHLGSWLSRQPDAQNLRLWEMAGTAHADAYTLQVGASDLGDDPGVADIVITAEPVPGTISCGAPINAGPQHFVAKAAVAALDEWVRSGSEPEQAPRLQVQPDGSAFELDEHGNVLGGIRTSYVEAPTAVLSGLGQAGFDFCRMLGTTVPFDEAKLAELYPEKSDYERAVDAATDAAVAKGFLLEVDGELIKTAAKLSDIGGGGATEP